MVFHLKIIGAIFIILALLHGIFPKYFNWKKDLRSLSLINREMMYIHTFFIAFVVFLMGVLCLACSSELVETALGKKIALGLCFFWVTRFFIQFWGYSSELWKGKIFETSVHILFSLFWGYVSVVFFLIYGADLM
jgi:hypothetical protein